MGDACAGERLRQVSSWVNHGGSRVAVVTESAGVLARCAQLVHTHMAEATHGRPDDALTTSAPAPTPREAHSAPRRTPRAR
jgi:hypothetical protein